MLALNFSRLLTCTTYTSSLPLYQISNFFTSPLTFSVIPTAVICQETYTVYTDTHTQYKDEQRLTCTSCNTSVLSEHKQSHTPPLCDCFLPTSSIINQEQQQQLLVWHLLRHPPHIHTYNKRSITGIHQVLWPAGQLTRVKR